MKISKNIINQFWEQAAIEQTARNYLDKGYSVTKQVRIADMQALLVAQKNNDVIFFDFKSGEWDKARANQALKLRNYVAHKKAGKFKLVLVNTPEEKEIQIEGLEDVIYNICLEKAMPELRHKVTQATLDKISDIEIHHSQVREKEIEVKGSAIAHFQTGFINGENLPYQESFLATFYLTLSHDLNLKTLYEFNIDMSSFDE